jgi:uncharacterized protein (TIGR03492 family)
MAKRVLFISNGHGEDNHSSHIIRRLKQFAPDIQVAAIPIVGNGNAYRNLQIPILSPTKVLPSGGFTYVNRWLLLKDIQAGLLGLTWQQLRALRKYGPQFDLIHATGDGVGQSCAYLTGRPFISFISCLSALYEGQLHLDMVLRSVVRSSRCLALVTRDPYTAENLTAQGFTNVHFGGIPSLDWLMSTGRDLQLRNNVPMVALLPGSRLPEALNNFKLQMRLVAHTASLMGRSVQFYAALVPGVMASVATLAADLGWQYDNGRLWTTLDTGEVAEIQCYDDAFNDIICSTTLVVGMAGLAVDQAVALGKPVIQIPGEGPQFNYAFAEAQDRLLGFAAQTIGQGPADEATLKIAAQRLRDTLQDKDYLLKCADYGRERLGAPGASTRIARLILHHLDNITESISSQSPARIAANRSQDLPIA